MTRSPLVGRPVQIRGQSPSHRKRSGVILAVLGRDEDIEYRVRLAPRNKLLERIAYFPARDVRVLPRRQAEMDPQPQMEEA